MSRDTDRIERSIQLNAARAKVWRALTNAESFGEWFGLDLKGQVFAAGECTRSHITFKGWEHIVCEMFIERIEPEHYFSYRWHPYAVDPNVDYSREPTTLVEFELEDVGTGTVLRVTESGFDAIPLERRAEALRMNSGGWTAQMANIERYVAGS